MNLKRLQENWDRFGTTDPLWSILTDPRKKGNKWSVDEFFESGRKEIDSVMHYIESLKITLHREKALDFGCGAGRLTQALATFFNEVYGVDIAKSMIDLAKKYNCHAERCKYILNEEKNLQLFENNGFDFIYSNIVLQHMTPKYSKAYIKEFIRILKPDGLLVFQQPSREKAIIANCGLREKIKNKLKNVLPSTPIDLYRNKMLTAKEDGPVMEMYEIKRKEIVTLVEENGATVIDILEDQSWSTDWTSFRYCVTKRK
jgi:ubiquinone/menaquinone biosynthesis C-methylase UbiE